MERSMRLRHLLAATALFSSLMFRGAPAVAAEATATATAKVPVGVVLDLASHAAGRKSLAAISMALEDFYVNRPTRVDLHVRDSRGDPATAALAAEDLIKNAQVLAIIAAPQMSDEADLLAQLGSRNRIPVLSFSSVSPTLHLHTVPYFVQTSPKDSSQVAPIVDIIVSFLGGHEVVIVCEDSPYGIGILQPLTEALQSSSVCTIDSVVVPIGVTDDHFDQMLYRLKDMSARMFVVNMRPALAVHLFSRAKNAGMVTEDYVWIATGALGNVVDGLIPDDIDNLQGILTLRPYVQGTSLARFKARFHLENLNTDHVHTPSVLMFQA